MDIEQADDCGLGYRRAVRALAVFVVSCVMLEGCGESRSDLRSIAIRPCKPS
jgi:hypothetical protein